MTTRLLMVVALLVPAMAFAEPDFSGAWVRDAAKSDVVPNTMYWLTRGVEAGGGRGRNSQTVIEVQQSAGRMQVTEPTRPLRTLILDGKPHAVPTDTGIQMATVVATVQGETLTVSTTQPFGGMPGNATPEDHGDLVAVAGWQGADDQDGTRASRIAPGFQRDLYSPIGQAVRSAARLGLSGC